MNTYKKAPAAVLKRLQAMRKKYHPELDKARVRIDVLMVETDGEDGAPLKVNGYACDGLAKIIPQEGRAAGRGDGLIMLDAEKWESMDDKQRDALLDHKLQHFQPVMADGVIAEDGQGRPRLRMRKHDVQVGWFDVVAKRHGEHSGEVMQARAIIKRAGDLYLPGFEFVAKGAAKEAGKVVKMPAQAPAQQAAAAK